MYIIIFVMFVFFCVYLVDNIIGFRVGGLSEFKDVILKI